MKRILALIICLLLMVPAALADDMTVVNCEEWVSLREAPSKSAARLKKVPLYAIVTDCEWTDGGFVRCTYDGATGHILDSYLEPLEPNEPESCLDAQVDGLTVQAYRQYGEGETLTVKCFGDGDEPIWQVASQTDSITELTQTTAFIGGTADAPRVMLYNAQEGLASLDLRTGDAVWTLSPETVRLGASISHAVDADGAMFISGYYGPDPVRIDADGSVRWQSYSGSDDIYWPYQIDITGEGIVTTYEMMLPGDGGRVVYDRDDGHVIRVEQD